MNRRFTLPAAVVACGTALALVAPNAASAGQATRHPTAAASSSIMNTSTKHHPFRIKAGKRYDVTATLSGVRRHDRLAFEAHYRTGHVGPKRWHVLGSWKLHRGEVHFRGAARATIPGLWTLRVQFLRHHRLLRGSQSNRFYVKVLRFKVHKHIPRKPKHSNGVSSSIVIPNWTDVHCAYPNSIGTGVAIGSPDTRTFNFSPNVNILVVVWVRDANAGDQGYGPWYVRTFPQSLGSLAGLPIGQEGTDPNHIRVTTLQYGDKFGNEARNEVHQIAWDFMFQRSDGSWQWVYPNSSMPGAYQQYDQAGTFLGQGPLCETWAHDTGL